MDPEFTVANLQVAVIRSARKLVSDARQAAYINASHSNVIAIFPDGKLASSDMKLSSCVEQVN